MRLRPPRFPPNWPNWRRRDSEAQEGGAEAGPWGQLAVEVAEVVGQDVRFLVGEIVAAWFGVQAPLHDVLVVAFGEATDAGEVAGEARQVAGRNRARAPGQRQGSGLHGTGL